MNIIPTSLLNKISGGTIICNSRGNEWQIILHPGESFDFGILPGSNDLLFDSTGAYHRALSTVPVKISTISKENAKGLGFGSFEMYKGDDFTTFTFSI